MTRMFSLSAAAVLMIVAFVGCNTPLGETVRSQNPGLQPAAYNTPADQTGAIIYADGGQTFENCPGDGPQGGCPHCGNFGRGMGCKHCNRIFAHYTQPTGLLYPPQNQPAGVTFYPYYTVKGPSDFFYNGN